MNTNANAAKRLPIAGLLALAMTGFLALLSEILPAGLLPQLSQGLGVSQSMAGQLTTFYAIGSVLGAVPIITATRNWRRRSLLLLTVGIFFVFNTITAISSIYILTLIARFFAGVAAGVVWGMLTGYARRMVSDELKGRAVSIAMMGIPIALTFGLPLGTFLSSFIGWRSLFGVVSLVAAVLIGWILWKLPDFPGQSDKSSVSVWSVFRTPGVRSVLFVVLAWMTAHNILYTYISPLLASVGFNQIEFILLIYGIASIVSTFLIGRLIDRYLRPLVIGSLIAFILVTVLFSISSNLPVGIYVAIILWGFVFGGAASLLQTAIAEAVDDQAVDIALSLSSTTWNFAIACGGAAGGILLNTAGMSSFPWVGFVLLILAMFVAWKAKKYGFKSKR
ncbi:MULTISPECIES: MFS transporter [Paenibacillus]|uniref:MFS transporter n=1 Tax=Paenibacillus TaxID=44249 RepID=UPI0013D4FB8F|nr:MFS transporter [Paenibacillus sp. ALJ109b]NEU64493.1 MFS transporter [Paenibacillus sp. ALJ109b]